VNVINSKYKPYCYRCYCAKNPGAVISKNFKLKEHHLVDSLREYYEDIELVHDKRIDDGCSLRRPDLRIECFTHTIIIECDEDRHTGYSCENKRIMEIFQDLGNRPIIFLRFNPDSYKDEESGETVKGCFKVMADNRINIQKKEWNRRISKLRERIDYHLINVPDKEVTIEHLFYS
jgi:hypothetical protein